MQRNQDKSRKACARLLYSEALHTCLPSKNKLERTTIHYSTFQRYPLLLGILLVLLVEIAGGQAPWAENSISGSHKGVSFMGSAMTALRIHLPSLGDNAHESPLKANKALTLSTCLSCYLALSVHILLWRPTYQLGCFSPAWASQRGCSIRNPSSPDMERG